MSDETEFFTVVFAGDATKLPFNPFKAETVFGQAVSIALGDVLAKLEEIADEEPPHDR